MNDRSSTAAAVAALTRAITEWRDRQSTPLVVAIDGHGAAGKSTLAERAATALGPGVAIVHLDDFWRVAGAAASGPPRSAPPLADYYDWDRLRTEALMPLLADRQATFAAIDPDTAATSTRTIEPGWLILVEGVSAACPQLADLVDRTVLVETPEPVRMRRLHARVPDDAWDEHWLDAERTYLASRPAEMFDLIVSGAEQG